MDCRIIEPTTRAEGKRPSTDHELLIHLALMISALTVVHQDGDGIFVKQVSAENLQRALDGDLYPYWSNRYLPLIVEQVE
jgi:hypothetical protein